MRGYAKYRSPGLAFVEQIPAHWEVAPFRHVFTESREVNGENPVGPMLSVSGYRGVEVKEYDSDNRRRTPEEVATYRVVRQGQLAVNTMWLNYSGLGVSAIEGHMSPAYRAYDISRALEPRYAHHLLRSSIYVQGYTALLTGIRPNSLQMSRDDLMSFPVIVPPLEEQRLIADYLDRETAEIDAFLADLENLKTLTTERVLALLEHELWGNADEVAPLRRFLLGVDQGISPEADSSPAGPGEVGVLKAGCTNNGRFDVWANKRLDSLDQFTASMFVAEGDLIVTRASGSLKHVGSAALVPCLDRKLAMSDKHYRLIPDHRLNGEYLALVMQTNRWRTQLEPLVSGAHGLARNISVANLKTLEIPVVSRAKQEETKANLREQIQKVGMASEDVDALISLGEERRAALISAAVTGQINVTEQGASAAEQLRDELEVHV